MIFASVLSWEILCSHVFGYRCSSVNFLVHKSNNNRNMTITINKKADINDSSSGCQAGSRSRCNPDPWLPARRESTKTPGKKSS